MRAASASMVLHCLKPMTFPIFNSNMGFDNIYVLNLVAASLRNGMQYLKGEHTRGDEQETMIATQIQVTQQELMF